jgi:hypothetical protein
MPRGKIPEWKNDPAQRNSLQGIYPFDGAIFATALTRQEG